MQKFNEKGQLPQGRYRRVRIPIDMNPTGKGFHRDRPRIRQ
jgi:hypothetical protein